MPIKPFTRHSNGTFNINNATPDFFNKSAADKVFNLSYKRLNWLLSPK